MGKNKQGARPHKKRAPYVDFISNGSTTSCAPISGVFGINFYFFWSLRMVKTSHQTSHLPFHTRIEPETESTFIHSFRKERKEEKKKTGETTPLDYLLTSLHPHLARDRDRSIGQARPSVLYQYIYIPLLKPRLLLQFLAVVRALRGGETRA